MIHLFLFIVYFNSLYLETYISKLILNISKNNKFVKILIKISDYFIVTFLYATKNKFETFPK